MKLFANKGKQIHPKDVKPMHHWVMHIFNQLRDYGPVYGFWTFLFKRLNKLLKSYSTNNHGAGEFEVSFFCTFKKDQELQTMLGNILAAEKLAAENDGSRLVVDCIQLMLATDGDIQGMVASLALETEQSSVNVNIQFSLGTHMKAGLSHDQQHQLIIHYQNTNPQAHVVSVMTCASTENPDPNYLLTRANFHNYIILDGRCVASSSSLVKASNSIIQVDLNDTCYVGQVFTIISHSQHGIE
ncbi:uncharacterized protein F5891DRAFT_1194306 [Suillus fuscotomentosus]|uniref:Uncharacterized protein n=1 Tax=Suillus fuscotomentosus TaxID=1912939 RepID=A0AAD4DW57_9AGAM|nr:uncharacterized protein F5891DRAFT_1194306 [Suillus fuscotomentosus]KAG1895251.1 hypothetical protein F5891DRAFT_1194306 [Suillus fuscotomentosus]